MVSSIVLSRATHFDQPDLVDDETAFKADPESRSFHEGEPAQPHAQIYTSFAEVEHLWRSFEESANGSVYQRYNWCKVWFDTFHPNGTATPLIVVVTLAGRAALLVPLYGETVAFGIKRAQFMGDSHANARIPLVTPVPRDIASLSEQARDGGLVKLIGQSLVDGGYADYLAFECMPDTFAGDTNLLALGEREKCSSIFFSGEIYEDFQALTMERRSVSSQRKQRKRFRKLEALGEYSLDKVEDAETLDRTLDVFFTQKAARLDNSQVYNAFDDAANETFIRRLAHDSLENDSHTLELYALNVNDETIAVAGGGIQSDRFSMGINSMSADSKHVACSAGRISIDLSVEMLCARGFKSFDLGVGENEYKRMWCSPVELYQVNRALTAKGRALLGLGHARNVVVTQLKRSPALVKLIKRAQFHIKRLGAR